MIFIHFSSPSLWLLDASSTCPSSEQSTIFFSAFVFSGAAKVPWMGASKLMPSRHAKANVFITLLFKWWLNDGCACGGTEPCCEPCGCEWVFCRVGIVAKWGSGRGKWGSVNGVMRRGMRWRWVCGAWGKQKRAWTKVHARCDVMW